MLGRGGVGPAQWVWLDLDLLQVKVVAAALARNCTTWLVEPDGLLALSNGINRLGREGHPMNCEKEMNLKDRIPELVSEDTLLEGFLTAVEDKGLAPYPAQEEAILEIMSGRHVVLNTPTGSGKSLVALAMHFKSLAEGKNHT